MDEQQQRRVGVAGGPDRELGAVERRDRPEVLGRQIADDESSSALGAGAPQHAAPRRRRRRPGRDGGRDHGRALPARRVITYSRGTRSPIRVTIS